MVAACVVMGYPLSVWKWPLSFSSTLHISRGGFTHEKGMQLKILPMSEVVRKFSTIELVVTKLGNFFVIKASLLGITHSFLKKCALNFLYRCLSSEFLCVERSQYRRKQENSIYCGSWWVQLPHGQT